MTNKQKTKKVKVTFFITGQEDKAQDIPTKTMFSNIWKSQAKKSLTGSKTDSNSNRELVLSLITYNSKNKFYLGYISIFRDSILPTIYNTTTSQEKNIQIDNTEEIQEKSYFIYFEDEDILVFQQNHLGPRPDDLAFMLYKSSNLQTIHFSPIWKYAHIKQVLEKGSIIKKCNLTIALPRKFKDINLDLDSNWGSDIIKMMSKNGMSKINLTFWGRASISKSKAGYIATEVKEGLKEFIEKFSISSREDSPKINKADVVLTDGNSESLLDKELSTTFEVPVSNGYPASKDLYKELYAAKFRLNKEIQAYKR